MIQKLAYKKNLNGKDLVFTSEPLSCIDSATALDRSYMHLNYGDNYIWFETIIKLKDWINSDGFNGEPESFYNVFQVIKDGQPVVIFINHKGDDTSVIAFDDFWMEDSAMNNDAFVVNYAEAVNRATESNYPKPMSKNCCLRKPLGMKDCNPQWVFGNIDKQIWVDAVTGEVRESNPAF